jgi:hypothetical protein
MGKGRQPVGIAQEPFPLLMLIAMKYLRSEPPLSKRDWLIIGAFVVPIVVLLAISFFL